MNRSRDRPGGSARAPRGADRVRMPCGVWAAPSDDRSTAPATDRPPSSRLIVSPTGSDRDRRAMSRGRRARPPRRAPVGTSGRAPSWTRTTSGSARRPSTRVRAPANPAATDSWRRAPPATTDARRCAGSQARRGSPRSVAAPSRGRSGATSARPRSRRASMRQASERPADDRRSSLSMPPIRLDDAGGDDDDDPRSAGRAARPVGVRAAPQSRRGWAKIIRPATVWRTRVTDTSRSLSM